MYTKYISKRFSGESNKISTNEDALLLVTAALANLSFMESR